MGADVIPTISLDKTLCQWALKNIKLPPEIVTFISQFLIDMEWLRPIMKIENTHHYYSNYAVGHNYGKTDRTVHNLLNCNMAKFWTSYTDLSETTPEWVVIEFPCQVQVRREQEGEGK